jgi:hypothetical protein
MNIKTKVSDCQVLLINENHEVYRAINDALRPLDLSVMWVRDVSSARMLARTTDMHILLCDPKDRPHIKKLFDPKTIRSGASCVELQPPSQDPRGTQFELNLDLARRLIRIVKNLLSVNHDDHFENTQYS